MSFLLIYPGMFSSTSFFIDEKVAKKKVEELKWCNSIVRDIHHGFEKLQRDIDYLWPCWAQKRQLSNRKRIKERNKWLYNISELLAQQVSFLFIAISKPRAFQNLDIHLIEPMFRWLFLFFSFKSNL